MATNFTIAVEGVNKAVQQLKSIAKTSEDRINQVVKDFGQSVATTAKILAPKDEGHLASSISSIFVNGELQIVVAANYAAYVEFGTRKFAASYVGTLPTEWQDFARRFQGAGGGTFDEMIRQLTEWVHRKGIAGSYSTKTRRRIGNKADRETQDKQVAYAIALKILREGIRPQPFLYPAYEQHKKELIQDLKNIFTI